MSLRGCSLDEFRSHVPVIVRDFKEAFVEWEDNNNNYNLIIGIFLRTGASNSFQETKNVKNNIIE